MKNIFGEKKTYGIDEIEKPIYFTCAACKSVYSEMLYVVKKYQHCFTKDLNEARSVIILGCQVTDLAVYNDLNYAEKYENMGKRVYVGGCLGLRFDLEYKYPSFNIELDGTDYAGNFSGAWEYLHWENPFWEKSNTLFRNVEPLFVGKGCKNKCKYCNIVHTRGKAIELDVSKMTERFEVSDSLVIIADSPTEKQIKDFCTMAIVKGRTIHIRNIEPAIFKKCFPIIEDAANFIRTIHLPIQNYEAEVLEDMGRNFELTMFAIHKTSELRKRYGIHNATNIIIDYKDFRKSNYDYQMLKLEPFYDYISVNPYWDGKYDHAKAKERFEKYKKY